MMTPSPQNQLVKGKNAFWWLSQKPNFPLLCYLLVILFFPTQLGKHFWPSFSFLQGLKIDFLSPTLYFTDVLIICLFLTVIITRSERHALRNAITTKHFLALVIVLFLLVVRGLFSLSPYEALYGTSKLIEGIFFGWYTSRMLSRNQVWLLTGWLVSIGILSEVALAVWQFVLQHSVQGFWYWLGERAFSQSTPGIATLSLHGVELVRPYGTFSHPNVLAGYLLIAGIFLLTGLLPQIQKHQARVFCILVLVLAEFGILLTLSRTAIILSILIALAYLLATVSKKYRLLSIIATLVLCLLFLISPFGARFTQTALSDQSITERVYLIQQSALLFEKQPVIGVGLHEFLPALANQNPGISIMLLQPVHVVLFLLLVDVGILGTLLVILFLFRTYAHLWRSLPHRLFLHSPAVLLLTTLLLLGLTDHYLVTLQQGQLLTAFVFGVCWSNHTFAK